MTGDALTEERRAALLDYCKLTELADDPEVQTLIPLFFSAAEGYLAQRSEERRVGKEC